MLLLAATANAFAVNRRRPPAVTDVRHDVGMDDSLPPVLEELFAVVVTGTHSGDVYWDRKDKRWLAEDRYSTGWRAQEPQSGDLIYRVGVQGPDPESLQHAADAAEAFKNAKYICGWCGIQDLGFHVVVPDIFGDAVIRCVLRPDPTTVNSSGGAGEKKHWAYAADACTSVKPSETRAPGDYYGPLVSLHLFGEPLTTMEALDRRWCSKCVNAAWTQRGNRRHDLEAALGREVTADELHQFETASHRYASESQLLRHLRAALDERGITDLRTAIRDSWQPLTAEKYMEEQRRFGSNT